MSLWVGARELYFALRDYHGNQAFDELAAPWLAEGSAAYRAQLEPLAAHGQPASSPERGAYWLAIPYALSRISDVLLLGFQPELDPAMDLPWAHQLHLAETAWPTVTREQYLELFTTLGMSPITGIDFDPLLHEIVEVDQAEDPDAPITVAELVWPGLMLGRLVFARAGVTVHAGANHAQRGIADRSPLYWTFLRRHRPTVDLSHGWGHNSQWDTDFRRDYRADDAQYLNIDVTGDIDADNPEDGEATPHLTGAERRDLVRHRCLLRTPVNHAALQAADPHWPKNLWPYCWPLTISRDRS